MSISGSSARLIETIGESIKYPIFTDKEGMGEDVIIAGPTCDSMDILYEEFKYQLPDTLEPGGSDIHRYDGCLYPELQFRVF